MKKPRLSDLIRDEASQTVKSEKTIEKTTPNTAMSSTNRSRMTKAQLDELVTELSSALEASKKQVDTLQTQVNKLESELQQKTELVSHLQAQVKEVNQDQSELAEQKQLVEKLYAQLQQKEEIAIQLEEKTQLIDSLKAELEQTKESAPDITQSSTIVAKKEIQQESALTRQARELEVFAAPPAAKQQKQLTNEDIGWFD